MHPPAGAGRGGRELAWSPCRYSGSPRTDARPRRRRRLGGADRRRHRGGPARRRAVVVSLQRPAGQQGDLPHRRSRTDAGYRVVANGVLVAAATGGASRIEWVLRAAEPMATYLATRADRALRRWSRRPASPSPDRRCRARRGAAGSRRPGRAFARQAEMMRGLRRPVRALPVRRATPSWSPTTTSRSRSSRRGCRPSAANHLAADWEAQRLIAHELAHQWFGNSADRSRAGATSGCTRGSPATPSGCGRRRRAAGRPQRAGAASTGALLAGLPQDLVLADPGPRR